jgi:quercetin dioxygenase-like cupin family protein
MEKSKSNIIVEIIEYVPDSTVHKTVIKKHTGTINTMSFDPSEGLEEKVSPFDNFVQVVEGKADIMMNGKATSLESGQGIMIPAHQPYSIKSKVRFKMIMTIIKNINEN